MSVLCEIEDFYAVSHESESFMGHGIRRFLDDRSGVDFRIPSLCLESGKMYALVGPSGVGKSVLISLLCGFPPFVRRQRISCREFKFLGLYLKGYNQRRVSEFLEAYRHGVDSSHIIYLPQVLPNDKSLAVKCSAAMEDVFRSIVSPHTSFSLRACREAILEALKQASLLDVWGRDLTLLSGGERRRVELLTRLVAIRMARKEDVVVILDEPTTGFDAKSQKDFLSGIGKQLQELTQDGFNATFVVSTHAMTYVSGEERLFDSVILLNRDKVQDVTMGTPNAARCTCAVVGQFEHSVVESCVRHVLPKGSPFSWSAVFECFTEVRTTDLIDRFKNMG